MHPRPNHNKKNPLIQNPLRVYPNKRQTVVGLLAGVLVFGLSAEAETKAEKVERIVEEVVVTGEKIVIEDLNEREVLLFYDAHVKGADLYKRKKYDEAKPYLIATAKLGFKMNQARLANIYLHGLGSTERDSVKGIGWLGVAATPTSTPGIRNFYRKLLRQIPQDQLQTVQTIVNEYIAKYGNVATGTDCNMIRVAGSHVATISCEVKDLYRFRDVFWNDEAWCFLNPDNCTHL